MCAERAIDAKIVFRKLKALKAKCDTVKDSLGLCDNDARAKGLIHVRQMSNTLAAIPNEIQRYETGDPASKAKREETIRDMFRIPADDSLDSWISDLNDNCKAAFLTLCLFALENCATAVLLAIGKQPCGKTLRDFQQLLQETGFDAQGNEYQRIRLSAYVRNTLHKAGVHQDEDVTVWCDGRPYSFKKGKHPCFCLWPDVLDMVHRDLEVVEAMFTHPKVASKTHIA